MRRTSKTPLAQAKNRIQALLRAIVMIRDGGCIFRELPEGVDRGSVPLHCNGYDGEGNLVLQADHLNSRAHNISYGVSDLVVCVCKGHHGWKSFMAERKKEYDRVVREIIGARRVKLWDAVEKDRKAYPFSEKDWLKVEIGLEQELKELMQG